MKLSRSVRVGFIVLVSLVLLASSVACTAGAKRESATEASQAEPSQSSVDASQATPVSESQHVPELSRDGWLMGVALPTDVSTVVTALGDPTQVDLPDLEKDPSPWGQWFRWSISNAYTYSVLNGDYSDQTPDFEADVSASVLRYDGEGGSPVVIDGFSLGTTTRGDVERVLGGQLESSDLASRWQFDDTGAFKTSLVRESDDRYTFYLFDADGVLVGLAQATFDMGNVD